MDLLRFSTAGSVDDGKSTLIGRLLFDSKGVFEDQLEAVQRSTRNRTGGTGIDLSLLTDGLRAEREQGITIDVAYRYFATPRRKFIIADTPGHEQYTRNMATGSSTAHLSIVLIDARQGVLVQSRRHAFIASLLGIPHLVVAVNKMDLVDWDRATFERIREEFAAFAAKLGYEAPTFIPLSALQGDNVVTKSDKTPWYEGPALLDHLETVDVAADENHEELRFPVQMVLRPHHEFRGFAGTIASGVLRVGDEVLALPAGRTTRVKRIHTHDGDLAEAFSPQAVSILLEDEIDISRGDMIVHPGHRPWAGRDFEARIVWMSETPLDPARQYLIKQTSRTTRARFTRIVHRVDVNTLERADASRLALNEIGRVRVSTAHTLFFDPYDRNRRTGSFVVVDPATNHTVAAGMIAADQPRTSENVVWSQGSIDRHAREAANHHRSGVLWMTGLSGAGKSTVARALEARLFHRGVQAYVLDGDNLRHGLCGDLGFSAEDRAENLRRAAETAKVLIDAGVLVIASFVSPARVERAKVRSIVGEADFVEIFVDAPLSVCEGRDPKGLYARARAGEIRGFTGIDAPYEAPDAPDLALRTDELSVEEAVDRLVALLSERGIFDEAGVVPPGEGI